MFESNNFFCIIYRTCCGGNHLANLLTTNNKFFQRFASTNYLNELEKKYNNLIDIAYDSEDYKRIQQAVFQSLGKNIPFPDATALVYNVHFNKRLGDRIPNWVEKETIDDVEFITYNMSLQGLSINASQKIDTKHDNFIVLAHDFNFITQLPNLRKNYFNNNLTNQFLKNLMSNSNITGIFLKPPTKPSRAWERLHKANTFVVQNDKRYHFSLPIIADNQTLFDYKNTIEIDTDKFFEYDGSYYVQDILSNKCNIILPDLIHTLHKNWVDMIDRSIDIVTK